MINALMLYLTDFLTASKMLTLYDPTLHGNGVATESAQPCFRAVWGLATRRLVETRH